VEHLTVIATSLMVLEQLASAVSQHDGSVLTVECDAFDQPLAFEVSEVALAELGLPVTPVTQIPFRHDPKGTDRRQRPRLGAVERIVSIAVADQLSVRSSRQVEVARKHVSGIIPAALVVAVTRVTVAFVAAFLVATRVVNELVPDRRRTRPASNFDPIIFTIADVIVSITRVNIVEHNVASEHASPLRTRSNAAIQLDYRESLKVEQLAIGRSWVVSG